MRLGVVIDDVLVLRFRSELLIGSKIWVFFFSKFGVRGSTVANVEFDLFYILVIFEAKTAENGDKSSGRETFMNRKTCACLFFLNASRKF